MNIFFDFARTFYGVKVPKTQRKNFLRTVINFLEERYSIETAVGMALSKMQIYS